MNYTLKTCILINVIIKYIQCDIKIFLMLLKYSQYDIKVFLHDIKIFTYDKY